MEKQVQAVSLYGVPPLLRPVFNLLAQAGAHYYALFGGAVRDADYAARHNQNRPIKDYDLRVWVPADQEDDFVKRLGPGVVPTPSAGTGRIRYCLDFRGAELDISVRPLPARNVEPSAVAIERAGDSDVGLCSAAIDSLGQAWAAAAYAHDRDNKTLTVYPMDDQERKRAYTTRMQAKFPDHRIIEL